MPFAPSSASPRSRAFPFSPERSLTGLWVPAWSTGCPQTPRASPRPLGTQELPPPFSCDVVSGATCCFAVSCVRPSLLPWEGGSFHGQGGRALSPGPGLWGALWAVHHSPSQLKALSPTIWPSAHCRPRSAPPGPREQWTLAPSGRNTRFSRPGASAPQPPSWGGSPGRGCPGRARAPASAW